MLTIIFTIALMVWKAFELLAIDGLKLGVWFVENM